MKLMGSTHFDVAPSRAALSSPSLKYSGSAFTRLVFSTIEKNPIAETLAKDIVGFNLPKFALSRTWNEFLDIIPLELGNTAITALSTLFIPALLRKPIQYVAGIKNSRLMLTQATKQLTSQAKLARLGVAFGFSIPFAAAFWALPFLRNYLTIKNLNTDSFENLIAAGSRQTNQKDLVAHAQYDVREMAIIMGAGLLLGAASAYGFARAARSVGRKALSPLMESVFKTFDLKGAGANQLQGTWPTFLFWSSPAYVGWIHASRGTHERREQLIKSINSTAWFFLVTPLMNKLYYTAQFNKVLASAKSLKTPFKPFEAVPSYDKIKALYKGPIRKQLLAMKDKQMGVSFLVTIFMLAMSPQILNIFLTRNRMNAERRSAQQSIS